MNPYSIPVLLGSLFSFMAGGFILRANRRSQSHISFAIFCYSLFVWLFGYALAYSTSDEGLALFACRIACSGAMFSAPAFYHFAVSYTNRKKEIPAVILSYLVMVAFFPFSMFSDLFLRGVYNYFWGYYSKAGLLHPVYLVVFFVIFLRGFYLFFQRKREALQPLERVQTNYIFLAYAVALLGAIDYLPKYGFEIFPFGFLFEVLFIVIAGYAIIRYHLLDIRVVISRLSIFAFVYSFVLGIPFILGYRYDLWMQSTWVMLIFATAGPFLYLAIQRRAEERLFENQRRYQATLRQAAAGMGRIKDMNKLIGLIVHIVTRSVRIEHSVVFVKQSDGQKYKFEGARSRTETQWDVREVDAKSPLIRTLKKTRQSLVYSEMSQMLLDDSDPNLQGVLRQMQELKAEVVVPSFVDENLIAFMVLGKKLSGDIYGSEDVVVFFILAGQAALAIENCQFYRDMRKTHEQLFQAEKMATIGIMADGLSHQINNRLHALGFIAGDALDTISIKKDAPMSDDLKEMIVDLEHALSRIQENVTQGGEIVRGLLKYSRKQEEEFEAIELDALIDDALKMAQFKIRKDEMDVLRDFPSGLPKIKGKFSQLQEVFFNLIDNAYDAMMQRKEELKEEGYRPTIEVRAEARSSGRMNIILKDNGMGIKAEDQVKVFTPFFTTKISSKKGTGLGLYVIKKLIEENHRGKVFYRSEYMKGTRVYVTLPTS